jgi:hypothetical protein
MEAAARFDRSEKRSYKINVTPQEHRIQKPEFRMKHYATDIFMQWD